MNRFGKSDLGDRIRSYLPFSLILFIVIMLIFLYGVSSVSDNAALNSRQLLEDALIRDISHCYAVEGSYPPSVKYMQEKYGLLFDESRFIVNYEYIGANIMPTYNIIER